MITAQHGTCDVNKDGGSENACWVTQLDVGLFVRQSVFLMLGHRQLNITNVGSSKL